MRVTSLKVQKCEIKNCESKIKVISLSKKCERKYVTVKYE